jgi:hypothetical protein
VAGKWDWRTFGTGDGFIADRINTGTLYASLVKIVTDSALYLDGGGLHVVDPEGRERVRLGEYVAGKYGLRLRNKAGDTTILDEDGIIQTDTIQLADNVDASHPLILKFYISPGVLSIKEVKLAFSLEPFRAYSKGAAAGGGSATTTSSGGGTSTTTASGGGTSRSTSSGGGRTATSGIQSVGSTLVDYTGVASGHSHGIYSHTHAIEIPDHSHDFYVPDHSHSLNIPSHSHSVNIPEHTHAIEYGIYEGTKAQGVTIRVNGVLRDGSGYNDDRNNIDLTQWITGPGWHTIELTSTQLGRINASLFTKTFVGM